MLEKRQYIVRAYAEELENRIVTRLNGNRGFKRLTVRG